MYFGFEHITSTSLIKSHDFNLVKSNFNILMTEESASSILLNGEKLSIEPYTVLIISSRMDARVDPMQKNPYFYLYFSESFLNTTESDLSYLQKIDYINDTPQGFTILKVPTDHISFTKFCCKQLILSYKNFLNPLMEELARAIVRQILIMIFIALNDNAVIFNNRLKKNEEHILMDFNELIQLHVHQEKNVAFYMDKLQITSRQLGAITKKAFDKTPKEVILDNLIKKAKYKLLHTDKSVKEVAWDLGFSEENNFSSLFHKKTGLTPSQIRKKLNESYN